MTRHDRAVGSLVATACGDALGSGYEFGPALGDDVVVRMAGGGAFGWAPGEWTDDTSMAVPIARAVAGGASFDDPSTLDGIVEAWRVWGLTAPDVGAQTRSVLGRLGDGPATEAAARDSARAVHDDNGQSAGNGSLMRTAPLVLGFVDDPDGLATAARRVSDLTHFEDDAGDACVLWCLAIRHTIVTGELDPEIGLPWLPEPRRARWSTLIGEARAQQPRDFRRSNGWVVSALQGALSAVHHGDGLVDTLERAVRGGSDTDTVAAIAGGLAGALHGASAVPDEWRRVLHGWPGLSHSDLVELAEQALGAEPTS